MYQPFQSRGLILSSENPLDSRRKVGSSYQSRSLCGIGLGRRLSRSRPDGDGDGVNRPVYISEVQ